MRRNDEAVRAAQSALQAADDDSERKYAQDFLDFASRERARRASAPTPAPAAADSPPASLATLAEAFTRACGAGDKSSCAHLAVLQAQGDGVKRDRPKALATLEGLCNEGFDDGCVGWAVVLVSSSRPSDVSRARQLLDAVCDRGNTEACRLLKSIPR